MSNSSYHHGDLKNALIEAGIEMVNEGGTENFLPFEYFKQLVIRYNKENGKTLSIEEQEIQIIKMWAIVHGISSIATMKNVSWNKKWEEQLHLLLY